MAPNDLSAVPINNCLYPKSMKIHDMMAVKIQQYFAKHLNLSDEDADKLHREYYQSYGLAIEGLVRHHKIDPLEYNRDVDDTLELDEVLKPNATLTRFLSDLDRTRVKPWILTNAYVTHAKRVLRLLDIEPYFEGVTYCDYGQELLICKPQAKMFQKAMMEAGVTDKKKCLFVDDSYVNVVGAKTFGWKEVCHLLFPEDHIPPPVDGIRQIHDLEVLREIYPHVFRKRRQNETRQI